MTDLATVDDVAARLGRALNPVEEMRVPALLEDASAAVRLYTGQTFTAVTGDVALLVPVRGQVILPQRPVNDVTSVADADSNDVAYEWYGDQVVHLYAAGVTRFDLDATLADPRPLTVTYDHGDDVVPPAIVAVVCGVVLRSLGRSPLDSGTQQQSIAGYSETIGPVGAAGPVGLLNEEKAILDKFDKRATRIVALW